MDKIRRKRKVTYNEKNEQQRPHSKKWRQTKIDNGYMNYQRWIPVEIRDEVNLMVELMITDAEELRCQNRC